MPQPTKQQVHIDAALTNISVAYLQDADNFIATKVFPVVNVRKQSDSYFTYDQGDFYRDGVQNRGPGTESAGSGWGQSTGTYNAKVWALHHDIDSQTRANYDVPLDADIDSTEFLTQQMMIRQDRDFVTNIFTTSTWTGSTTASDITPGNLWDTVAGTPIDDVAEQYDSISEKTGYTPNTLVVGPEVFKELKEHPDILDRIKYTERGIVTKDLLASLFEVDRVFVPRATYNTASENATDSFDFIYGKNALLLYVAPSPGVRTPSAGYTFRWSGDSTFQPGISKFFMPQLKSDRVEIEEAWVQKQIGATLGVFFSAVVS